LWYYIVLSTIVIEASQGRFYRGQVIPLCFGAFGETNEDLDKIIRRLAREAASGDDGMTITSC
jgi:hypothetical protein